MARIASAPAGDRWDPKITDGFYVFELAALPLQARYRVERRYGNPPAIARVRAISAAQARPIIHVDNRHGRRPWQQTKNASAT